MLTGSDDEALARALETYCTLAIDHGFNSSTFTARVVASTGADLGACVLAAYGALTGPRHGAVQSRVLDMLDEIATPDRAEEWMRTAMASRRRILGFGHSVYRTVDPRVAVLRERHRRHRALTATSSSSPSRRPPRRVLAGRNLAANVDLYSPVLLDACAIPRRICSRPRSPWPASSAGAPTSSSRRRRAKIIRPAALLRRAASRLRLTCRGHRPAGDATVLRGPAGDLFDQRARS